MCRSKEAWDHFIFVPRAPPRRVARAMDGTSFLSVRSDATECKRRKHVGVVGTRADAALPESATSELLRSVGPYAMSVAAVACAGAAVGPGPALVKCMMVPPIPPPAPDAGSTDERQVASPSTAPQSLLQMLFPGFETDTFIWRVSVLQIMEYVGSLMLGNTFSSPKLCSLYLLGASWGPAIAGGALWRLFLPIMLHANALHIFFNLFFQMRIGFGMEKQFGRKKFCMLYLFCGFLGNLLSVVMDPMKLAVGASTSGFGLLGVWAAEVLLTWEMLGGSRPRVFLWFAFMLLSCAMMSQLSPNVDFAGHFGGALAGFLFAIIFADMREEHQPPWYGAAKAWARNVAGLLILGGLVKTITFGPEGPIPYCGAIFHPRVLPF
mmetsp:Transcript_113028/g.319797  ORF Transcript_113028/g.319797 Transcript_113028/m.319797 type:complete len:379 (+) Transcript_113028:66-1202(+)